jgi:hydrogenase maturation protease
MRCAATMASDGMPLRLLREADARVIPCHQLTPELADPVSQADLVIFIDTAQRQPPGRLTCRRIVPRPSPPGALSHHLTPPVLLACAQAFYGRSPEAVMLSVSGGFFGYGEQLSPAVQEALPRVVERVGALLAARRRHKATRMGARRS